MAAAYRLLNTAYTASQITGMSKEVRDRSGVNVLICIHEPSSQNSWEATKYSKCVSPVISKGRIHL